MHGQLFANLTTLPTDQENFSTLLQQKGLRIERIVSYGQCSPKDFWYDQADGEWVILLAGSARLRFADEETDRELQAGDWLEIRPHRRHRVVRTSSAPPAVWLAVHYATPSP